MGLQTPVNAPIYRNLQLLNFSVLADFSQPIDCSTTDFPVLHYYRSLLKLMSTESMMLSNYLILCHPFLLLPSVFSNIRLFSSESVLHITWPMYWRFSFSISPSSEYSGLIFFRTDWLVLSPCCPNSSQECYEALQFKSIDSLTQPSLCPTLTFIHDYLKNHSFE